VSHSTCALSLYASNHNRMQSKSLLFCASPGIILESKKYFGTGLISFMSDKKFIV
jgi:hypothetical protein